MTQQFLQLCVSPDYVLVPRAIKAEFVKALLKIYQDFWPNGAFDSAVGWASIVNPAHHKRLRDMLERSKGKILIGGEFDGERRIAPTIIDDVKVDDSLMEE